VRALFRAASSSPGYLSSFFFRMASTSPPSVILGLFFGDRPWIFSPFPFPLFSARWVILSPAVVDCLASLFAAVILSFGVREVSFLLFHRSHPFCYFRSSFSQSWGFLFDLLSRFGPLFTFSPERRIFFFPHGACDIAGPSPPSVGRSRTSKVPKFPGLSFVLMAEFSTPPSC